MCGIASPESEIIVKEQGITLVSILNCRQTPTSDQRETGLTDEDSASTVRALRPHRRGSPTHQNSPLSPSYPSLSRS